MNSPDVIADVTAYLHQHWELRRWTAMLNLDKDEVYMRLTEPWQIAQTGTLFIRAASNGTVDFYAPDD